MSEFMPPLIGVAPGLECGRLTAGERGYCGRPATWHVIWDQACSNGLLCDEHAEEARQRWVFFAIHPYDPTCSFPGALYVYRDNRCVVDEAYLLDEVVAIKAGNS